jgi:hypothetical protein
LCGSADECKTPKRSYPIHPRLAHALCVLSAKLSLELSECKVVPTLWDDSWVNQGVQGAPEALWPKWLTDNRSTLRLGVEWQGHFVRGTWRPPSLVEKLLSGGGIKVAKGAWQVPKWLAFVTSQVVLLGETWWSGSNTLVWVLQQRELGVTYCLPIPRG